MTDDAFPSLQDLGFHTLPVRAPEKVDYHGGHNGMLAIEDHIQQYVLESFHIVGMFALTGWLLPTYVGGLTIQPNVLIQIYNTSEGVDTHMFARAMRLLAFKTKASVAVTAAEVWACTKGHPDSGRNPASLNALAMCCEYFRDDKRIQRVHWALQTMDGKSFRPWEKMDNKTIEGSELLELLPDTRRTYEQQG